MIMNPPVNQYAIGTISLHAKRSWMSWHATHSHYLRTWMEKSACHSKRKQQSSWPLSLVKISSKRKTVYFALCEASRRIESFRPWIQRLVTGTRRKRAISTATRDISLSTLIRKSLPPQPSRPAMQRTVVLQKKCSKRHSKEVNRQRPAKIIRHQTQLQAPL